MAIAKSWSNRKTTATTMAAKKIQKIHNLEKKIAQHRNGEMKIKRNYVKWRALSHEIFFTLLFLFFGCPEKGEKLKVFGETEKEEGEI